MEKILFTENIRLLLRTKETAINNFKSIFFLIEKLILKLTPDTTADATPTAAAFHTPKQKRAQSRYQKSKYMHLD